MKSYTDQEAFNKVARHLFAQGHRAVVHLPGPDGELLEACAYRTEDGSKCAVGALMPDDLYDKSFERLTFSALLGDGDYFSIAEEPRRKLKSFFASNNPELMAHLQAVHDTLFYWKSTEAMKENLKLIALQFRLNYEVLDELQFKGW